VGGVRGERERVCSVQAREGWTERVCSQVRQEREQSSKQSNGEAYFLCRNIILPFWLIK